MNTKDLHADRASLQEVRAVVFRLVGRAFIVQTLLICALEFMIMLALDAYAPQLDPLPHSLLDATLLGAGVGIAGWILVVRPLAARLFAEHAAGQRQADRLEEALIHREHGMRLHRALDQAQDEGTVELVTCAALQELALPAHIAHYPVTDDGTIQPPSTGDRATPRCGVRTREACPALRGGEPVHSRNSTKLSACAVLMASHQDKPAVAAACVPTIITGRPSALLHMTWDEPQEPNPENEATMSMVAAMQGQRTAHLRLLHRSQRAAVTDPLTRLANRRALTEYVKSALRSTASLSLVLADLDHFKRINDVYGHDVGDAVLVAFARALEDDIRIGDMAARFGGEEFVIVLPGRDAADAARVVQRIRAALPAILSEKGAPPATASFGIADTTSAQSLDELLRNADTAMYRSKDLGRDRLTVFTPLAGSSLEPKTGPPPPHKAALKAESAGAGHKPLWC